MQLDLTNLFNGGGEDINIDCVVDMTGFEYSTYCPIKNGAKACGRIFSKADVVYLQLNISFDFFGICDRCAENVTKHYAFDLEKILVPQLANDDDDDDESYIVVDNNLLDIDALVNEEVQLFLPHKMLCSDDCKGLCPKCGKNLNSGKCDCKADVDPRLSSLLQLLDDE